MSGQVNIGGVWKNIAGVYANIGGTWKTASSMKCNIGGVWKDGWSSIDSYTKLLLHCDGTNGSTTFIDETGKTVTANGNAQISTAQSKFGGSSAYFDGSGDYLEVPDSDDWYFDTGALTIDFQCNISALPTSGNYQVLFRQDEGYLSQNFWGITIYNDSGTMQIIFGVYVSSVLALLLTANISLSTGVWTHIALVRNGDTFTFYKDGVSIGSTTQAVTIPNFAAPVAIAGTDTQFYYNGYLDEIRISKGIARWTSNFTPPTAPY